ncbi:MAG: tetratricopeptide repeat protein [Paludibacter sp.]
METLKKIFLSLIITGIAITASAQSQSVIQSAYVKSYESEQVGSYSAALNEIKAIYNVKDYTANIRLGWLSYLLKQYSEAIRYYNIAIGLKPYAIEARFGCIKPLSAIESWEKVKYNYLKILEIDPQNSVANYWLGVMYYNGKDYSNAQKLFEKVVNLYPLDYDSTIMLAWSKLNLGKNTEARYLFNQALILRPSDSSALAGLKLIK